MFGWLGFFFFSREDDNTESLKIVKSLVIRNVELCITIQFSLHADLKRTPDSNSSIFFYGVSVKGPCFKTQFFWEYSYGVNCKHGDEPVKQVVRNCAEVYLYLQWRSR